MPASRPWREHALSIAVLLLSLTIVFYDVLGSARGLFFRDHILVFKPRWWAISESARALVLPTLTRASSSGVPIEQLLNATYTPLAGIFLFGRFEVMYDVFVIAHFAVLGVGAYALSIDLGARVLESLCAAAVAMLAGPVLSLENLVVALQGLAYAPWVYLFVSRFLRSATAVNGAALALSVGFHLQGIIPEVLLLDLLVLVGILLVRRPAMTPRLVLSLISVGALGAALASIEVMPVLEVLSGTRRGEGFSYESVSGWALNPLRFVDLVAPAFWAPPDIPFLNLPRATGLAVDPPYFVSLYFGTALVLVACVPLERRTIAVMLCALFFLVVAMGRHTPLHAWIASLPLLRNSRYAIKYLIIVAAAFSFMTPIAIQQARRSPRRFLLTASLYAGLVASLLSVVGSPEAVDFLAINLRDYGPTPRVLGVSPGDFPGIATHSMKGRLVMVLVPALCLCLVGILMVLPRLERWRTATTGIAVAIVLFDLSLAGSRSVFGADVLASSPPDAVIDILRSEHDRFVSIYPGGRIPPVIRGGGRTYFEDIVRAEGQRGQSLFQGVRRYQDLDLDGQSNPLHARIFAVAASAPREKALRIMSRLGVRYVLSSLPDLSEDVVFQYRPADQETQYVHRLSGVRNYVEAYTDWHTLRPSEASNEDLLELFSRSVEPRAAIVAADRDEEIGTSTVCKGNARLHQLPGSTDRIVDIGFESPCPAIVVVREPWMNGWTVSVDGRPSDILQAEAGFIAVRAPSGARSIRFEYAPRATKWARLTAAAFVVIGAMLGVGLLSRLRRNA